MNTFLRGAHRPLRVLELGSYIIPAYAGMLLAEQGHEVTKWAVRNDPVLDLHRGGELWAWLNEPKLNVTYDRRIDQHLTGGLADGDWDIILDNVRAATWERWGLNPADLADQYQLRWVSMRSDTDLHGARSFDVVAQARSWMEYSPWVPFYAGDTTGGLWMAFKALASAASGHHVLHQASLMQKLVEGELVVDGGDRSGGPPWDDPGDYNGHDGATVRFRGTDIHEPIRDRAWKLKHLDHHAGRIRV